MSRRTAEVAGKKERQRKLARDAHQRRMERQAERTRRARQLSVVAIVVVLVAGVGVVSAYIAGAFSTRKAAAAANSSASPSVTPSSSPSATPSPSNTAAMVNGKCVYIKNGTAVRKVNRPPAKPDTKASYVATVKTNRGTIVIDLLNSQAPCTVGSFVSLASQHYYNNTPCPRVTTTGIYVLQCGDPTGTGRGGPGYEFGNENLTGATYPAKTVAMANLTGVPDSNGSQFFLVYKNTPLPPNYTPFGTIVSGLNVIQNVAKAGSDNSNSAGDGHPKESVKIESVTIKKT